MTEWYVKLKCTYESWYRVATPNSVWKFLNESQLYTQTVLIFLFSERLLVVTEHYQQTLKKVAKSGKYSAYVTFIDPLYMHAQSKIVFVFAPSTLYNN